YVLMAAWPLIKPVTQQRVFLSAASVDTTFADRLATGLRALRNPYKGLHAFTVDDAGDFFGRERLVDVLVKDVAEVVTAEQPTNEGGRLLAIIGPSGSAPPKCLKACTCA